MWILILYLFTGRGPQLDHIEFTNQTNCMNAMYDFKNLKSLNKKNIHAVCVKK